MPKLVEFNWLTVGVPPQWDVKADLRCLKVGMKKDRKIAGEVDNHCRLVFPALQQNDQIVDISIVRLNEYQPYNPDTGYFDQGLLANEQIGSAVPVETVGDQLLEHKLTPEEILTESETQYMLVKDGTTMFTGMKTAVAERIVLGPTGNYTKLVIPVMHYTGIRPQQSKLIAKRNVPLHDRMFIFDSWIAHGNCGLLDTIYELGTQLNVDTVPNYFLRGVQSTPLTILGAQDFEGQNANPFGGRRWYEDIFAPVDLLMRRSYWPIFHRNTRTLI